MAARSTYFERMLQGAWLESGQKQITLKEVEKHSFEIILNFIYLNRLPIEEPQDAVDFYRLGIS